MLLNLRYNDMIVFCFMNVCDFELCQSLKSNSILHHSARGLRDAHRSHGDAYTDVYGPLKYIILKSGQKCSLDLNTCRKAKEGVNHYLKCDNFVKMCDNFGPTETDRQTDRPIDKVGMKQQYALGRFLRSEYGHLLSEVYNHTEIVVAASNVDRCLMSAYSNLAGLYPPQGDQVWNPDLLWQPIPVHTRPQDEDHVLAIEEKCPRYNELYHKELQSPPVKAEEKANSALYDYLGNYTGIKTENISNAWQIGDALLCEKTHNMPLPEWALAKWGNSTVYDMLRANGDFSFNLLYNSTELSRLTGGPLLKVFIQNMQKAAQQKPHYRMYMYSAHDSTVAAVSDAMKVFDHLMPPYAAALLVELHQTEDAQFCVQIRYRNDTHADPYPLVHPDCQKECCPLDEFEAVTKSRIPENWDKECGNRDTVTVNIYVVISVLATVVITVLVMLVVICLALYRRCRRRNGYLAMPQTRTLDSEAHALMQA